MTRIQRLYAALAYAGTKGRPMSLTEFGVAIGYNAQYAVAEAKKPDGCKPVVAAVEAFIAQYLPADSAAVVA